MIWSREDYIRNMCILITGHRSGIETSRTHCLPIRYLVHRIWSYRPPYFVSFILEALEPSDAAGKIGSVLAAKDEDHISSTDRETIDDREGRLLLRPTDSNDIQRLNSSRSKSSSKNASSSDWPSPVFRSISAHSGESSVLADESGMTL